MDSEVQHEVWNARIPVQFTMHPGDVSTYEKPQPQFVSYMNMSALWSMSMTHHWSSLFQLLVQRITYFPIVTEQIQKYFMQFIAKNITEESANDAADNEMWLEYEGQPIKW